MTSKPGRSTSASAPTWFRVDGPVSELYDVAVVPGINDIGKPKSAAGERLVHFGKFVVNLLKEWKLACAKSDGDLVFPNGEDRLKRQRHDH